MPITSIPKHPVVDPDPSLPRTVANFNFRDYMHIGAFSAMGYAIGWFPIHRTTRNHNAAFCAFLGFMGGTTYAFLSSTQRFMGLEPNESEVRRYGIMSDKEFTIYRHRQMYPNIDLIDYRGDPTDRNIKPESK